MKWKSIEGYEGIYEISDTGIVYSVHRITSDGKELTGKVVKGGCYPNGYKFVCLRNNGKNKNYMIHRLVAKAFLPNPENFPCVNHMDGNKQNNSVENLEWCTFSKNRKHAYDFGLSPQKGAPRTVIVKCGEHITTFETMKDCATFFGYKKGWLQNQIRKHGLTFNYKGYEIEVSERV